ncbi:unnamed protein product [Amoebophrya sp. A25]|nr:unnamed protein product [Amoebophrya sp. A25]|eukprot:GSA25T00017804001.1
MRAHDDPAHWGHQLGKPTAYQYLSHRDPAQAPARLERRPRTTRGSRPDSLKRKSGSQIVDQHRKMPSSNSGKRRLSPARVEEQQIVNIEEASSEDAQDFQPTVEQEEQQQLKPLLAAGGSSSEDEQDFQPTTPAKSRRKSKLSSLARSLWYLTLLQVPILVYVVGFSTVATQDSCPILTQRILKHAERVDWGFLFVSSSTTTRPVFITNWREAAFDQHSIPAHLWNAKVYYSNQGEREIMLSAFGVSTLFFLVSFLCLSFTLLYLYNKDAEGCPLHDLNLRPVVSVILLRNIDYILQP